jgi:acetyl-CoA carboxylase biotin carboxyl carrier protein
MDLRKVKTLIDLVQQSDISELEIQEGEERVRISRKPAAGSPGVAGVSQMMAPPMMYAAAPEPAPPTAPAVAETPVAPQGFVLKSPMVGTFYRSSTPGGQPFVELGQAVKADQTVCIIEAMKLLNEIEAGQEGVIKEILVENGQPVEYGQPLIRIE